MPRYTLIEVENRSSVLPSNHDQSAVSCVVFPVTDLSYPPFFLCGSNNGILSWYHVGMDNSTPKNSKYISWSHQISLGSAINDVALCGDNLRAAIATEDGSVRLVDASSLKTIDILKSHSDGPATCVCFTPQSNVLIVGTYAGTILMYDGREPRKLIRRLSPAHATPVSAVASHPDGSVFLSTGIDGIARVWDSNGSLLATIVGSENRGLGSGLFSPNGRFALLGALADGALCLWDLAHSGRLKWVRKYPRLNSRYWMRASFMEGGIIVSGSEEGKLMAWDPSSTLVIAEYDSAKANGVHVPLACSATGPFVVCGGIGSALPIVLELISE